MATVSAPAARLPSRWQAGLFRLKTGVFQAVRAWREFTGRRPPRLRRLDARAEGPLLAENRSALFTSANPAEFALQAGKVQNLRAAAARLDGLLIPHGAVFSFWRNVPRPTRGQGFVAGRELREGCIVPSIGGGLCQLSNALYAAALDAGGEIVERHAHSRQVPGSMAEAGRDATVFWNYVDLRFRLPVDCRPEVALTRRELAVGLRAVSGIGSIQKTVAVVPPISAVETGMALPSLSPAVAVESCETCDVAECFRHPGRAEPGTATTAGTTAWLVDAWQPEFDEYLRAHRQSGDFLCVPLDSARWRLGPYRWDTSGFARVRQAALATLHRSWKSRRLASQGAARQQALLRFDETLSCRFTRGLPASATHLVISQNLLPHLWRSGALGGRSFDVLMTRLPISVLQRTLDRAAARHPQSRTLADFRAVAALADDEDAALAAARHWVTPHSGLAALAGPRAVKLAWQTPSFEKSDAPASSSGGGGSDVRFPASTLGRKGAYELAEAARRLGLRVQLGGPCLEDAGCWRGVETTPARDGWQDVGVVVLPAWVEHQPRRLLRAAAAGVPVVASDACGLAGVPGVVTVPSGDVSALIEALSRIIQPIQALRSSI